ncbi:hypothetical protein RSAG8_12406, partial [Rhizoctonia solani AG-8 WAC10335]
MLGACDRDRTPHVPLLRERPDSPPSPHNAYTLAAGSLSRPHGPTRVSLPPVPDSASLSPKACLLKLRKVIYASITSCRRTPGSELAAYTCDPKSKRD